MFDRSQPLPTGGHLEQADGTAWMAFYCNTMLAMALELASEDPAYEDVASKFFEHFIAIADAINTLGGTGLWVEEDGFYYDQLHVDGSHTPLRIRSLVGLMPLSRSRCWRRRSSPSWRASAAAELVPGEPAGPGPADRLHAAAARPARAVQRLLAIPSRERLERVLRYLLDESEFLSPHGIRSVSRVHRDQPYEIEVEGMVHRVDYDPGESSTGLFGGNSNWRGPVWFPLNYLLLEALERYPPLLRRRPPGRVPRRLGTDAEPPGGGPGAGGAARRDLPGAMPRAGVPAMATDARFASDPHWNDLVLFHEYFHGDTGRGVGASHQTGWTALVVRCIEDQARRRTSATPPAPPSRAPPAGLEPHMRTPSRWTSATEWLEPDGLGGFASGTAAGLRTRRYHALLLAATTPPTGRMVLVNGLDAWVESDGHR